MRCARDDESVDAGKCRVVSDGGDSDPQPRIGRDRAGGHRIALAAGRGVRFAGDHRFIHGRTSVNNHAVGRHAAARAHDHEIINAQLRRAHRDGRFTLDPLGFVGQKRREGVERRSGLGERTHLDPVPEQHNDHQQREFPPEFELVMQQPECCAPRCEEGHGDAQGDQQHHARFAGLDFAHRVRQEWGAAPDIHHGADNRCDPRGPAWY